MTHENGPHHADDTVGDEAVLVEFTTPVLPHDSPEYLERASRPWKPRNTVVAGGPPAAE
jgi:hypothetical protein